MREPAPDDIGLEVGALKEALASHIAGPQGAQAYVERLPDTALLRLLAAAEVLVALTRTEIIRRKPETEDW